MPGAYAHLTLANEASAPALLERANVPLDAITAILDWKKFVELGAVSPDLSYLIFTGNAKKWADKMHYVRSGDVIKSMARRVRAERNPMLLKKKLAWLLGYTLHVGGDTTIHPVVRLKVGDYEQNKTAHRICEMNQDAYIFQRLNVGPLGLGDFLSKSICACNDEEGNLDSSIVGLWEAALEECYPDEFSENRPTINAWFQSFNWWVGEIGGLSLIPLARHVCIGEGLAYPSLNEIDYQYIHALRTPRNIPMPYDEIFDFAKTKVVSLWATVADYVINGNECALERILNLNLDTGEDSEGTIRMWAEA